MVETLIDRSVNMKEDTEPDQDIQTEKLVDNLRVENNYYIIAETVTDEEITICNLSNIRSKPIDEIISERCENLYISEDIKKQLTEIRYAVKSAYNEEFDKYELQKNKNEYGQIDYLYIPMRCDHIDDIIVYEIFDEEGEFVGDKLEDTLEEETYKIDSYDLLVDSPLYPDKISKISKYNKSEIRENTLEESNIVNEMLSSTLALVIVLFPFIMMSIDTSLGLYSLVVLATDFYYDAIDNMFKFLNIFEYIFKSFNDNYYAEELFSID